MASTPGASQAAVAAQAAAYAQAAEEAARVITRQAACERRVAAVVDSFIAQVQQAQAAVAAGRDPSSTLVALRTSYEAGWSQANSATKDLHSAIGKLSKLTDKVVDDKTEVTKLMRSACQDPLLIHRVISQHLFRAGRFEAGRAVLKGVGAESEADGLAAPYITMHQVLSKLQQRDLDPALQWAQAQLLLLQGAQRGPAPAAAAQAQPTAMQVDAPGAAATGAASATAELRQAAGTAAGAQQQRLQVEGNGAEVAAVRNFQLTLHTLSYITQLLCHGQGAALAYAKTHLSVFAATHMPVVQRLMGCLVFCRPAEQPSTGGQQHRHSTLHSNGGSAAAQPARLSQGAATAGLGCMPEGDVEMGDVAAVSTQGVSSSGEGLVLQDTGRELHAAQVQRFTLRGSPYADLGCEAAWQQCAQEFQKLACRLMGLATESPLAVVLAAGAGALPALLKMAAVLERTGANTPGADLLTCEQLPLELELGPEFVFQPIFACPVSREQSTPDNPPMLLPCGHVLCEQSVLRIAKTRTRVFKCPYCPVEARPDNLRQLVFPPAGKGLGLAAPRLPETS